MLRKLFSISILIMWWYSWIFIINLNHHILMIWCSRNISRKQLPVAVFVDFFHVRWMMNDELFIWNRKIWYQCKGLYCQFWSIECIHTFISEFHWHCDHWAVIINKETVEPFGIPFGISRQFDWTLAVTLQTGIDQWNDYSTLHCESKSYP